MQYVDLLRDIKSKVNIKDAHVEIKGIRQTMKGDLLIEVMGGKEKSETLKKG